jgi:hypothetical protein
MTTKLTDRERWRRELSSAAPLVLAVVRNSVFDSNRPIPEIRSRFYRQKPDIRSRHSANIIALRMLSLAGDPGSLLA